MEYEFGCWSSYKWHTKLIHSIAICRASYGFLFDEDKCKLFILDVRSVMLTLENTEREIKTGQSTKTGNIGYTRRGKTKQKHNTICGWTPL